MIWKTEPTLEALNAMGKNTLGESIGMEFTAVGADFMTAKIPVDHRTVQPFRILHGGASVSLAETLGSVASYLCIDTSKYSAVGLEINANHLSSVREGGVVFGTVKPIRVGKTIHVWQIEIKDEREKLVCISRFTVAIIDRV